MKPDVIVSWPVNNDYPLWREMLRGYRHKVGNVFVVFTQTNDGYDLSGFVRYAMRLDGVDFITSPPVTGGADWRDVAVNEALNRPSHNEWVWFTEQDFFVRDGFWELVTEYSDKVDIMYASDEGRMHPCCIIAPRRVINQTSKRFGIIPNELDHFGIFQRDIERMDLSKLVINGRNYTHMNGLSHNFTLMRNGQQPNYYKDKFDQYLKACLDVDVELDLDWKLTVAKYLEKQNEHIG